jgi:hypothetical protein
MPFLVEGCLNNRTLAVTTATAKEAFARAVEWSIAERVTDVSIYDGSRSYSIGEFASVMALLEIAKTVNAPAEPKAAK